MSFSESSVFLLANGLLLFAAARVAAHLLPEYSSAHRLLAALVAFGAMVNVVVVGLGLPGWLSTWTILIAASVIAATCWAVTRRSGVPTPPGSRPQPSDHDFVTRTLPLLLVAAVASAWLWETVVAGTNLAIDDFTYHGTEAAYWLQQGAIRLSPYQYQTYYPHLPEVFTFWFMFPSRTDCVASLTSLYAGALGAAAVWSITESLGAQRPFKLIACCLFLCAPIIQNNPFRTLSSKDLLAGSTLAAGMALLLAARSGSRAAQPRHAAIAGTAWGLAAGVSVAPVALVPIAIAWLLREARGASATAKLSTVISFCVPCVLIGAVWYLQNWIASGNPAFPIELGPFDGPISSAVASKTSVLWWIQNRFDDPDVRQRLLTSLYDWPYQFSVAVTAALALSVASVFVRKLRDRNVDLICLLLITVICFLALFLVQPFGATTADYFNDGIKGPKFRFLAFVAAVGAALIGSWMSRAPRRAHPWLVVGATALVGWSWLDDFGQPLVMLLAAAGVVAGLVWASRHRTSASAVVRRLTLVPVVLALLVGEAAWSPHKREATDAKLLAAHDGGVTGVFRILFSLPDGSRVACFNGLPFSWTRWYPVFGRKLNLIPIALARDGRLQPPLHVRWRDERSPDFLAMAFVEAQIPVDPVRFRERLVENRIDYVFMTKWTLGSNEVIPWPPPYQALFWSAYPRLYSDEMSAIWDVRRTDN